VQKTVDFLKANRERLEKTLQNRNYAVINDFTQDSTNKRMIVLNLKTKKVERYLVSHGHGKPVNSAKAPGFSNTAESDLTPPGFLVMKERVVLKSDDERPIKR
jgi:tRNA nucleotidyltransferase (CCA-adding enzyme)